MKINQKALAEAEPWMSLREQWAGQPLSSNVPTRPAARAQGGAGQLRRGRRAWCGALTVWLWAWGHGEGEGKDVLMALDRLQKPQDARAVHLLSGQRHQHILPLFCLSRPNSLWKSLTSLTSRATLDTLAIVDTAFFLSVQYTPALRKNVAAAPKS